MALYTVSDAGFSVCCCKSTPHARSILVTSSRHNTVRGMARPNLVGCRGQREQSMGGAPPGSATLNLGRESQGSLEVPRFQPLMLFLVVVAAIAGLADWQKSPRGFCVPSQAIHELPQFFQLSTHPQGPGSQDGKAFLDCNQPNKGRIAHAGSGPYKVYSKAISCDFVPTQGPQGRRRPGSKHKLIMDSSAPTLSNHVRLLLPCNRAGLHFWPPLVLCVTMLNEAMICHNFSSLSSSPVKLSPCLLPSDYCFRWRQYSRP